MVPVNALKPHWLRLLSVLRLWLYVAVDSFDSLFIYALVVFLFGLFVSFFCVCVFVFFFVFFVVVFLLLFFVFCFFLCVFFFCFVLLLFFFWGGGSVIGSCFILIRVTMSKNCIRIGIHW